MSCTPKDHRWVIVLAGGNGTRLASLTRDDRGSVVPKQYCSLGGDRSLLGDAMARAAALATDERIVVVVAREHEDHWRREFGRAADARLVVQPQNRGTAAGVLLPLAVVLHRDPDAVVTVLPSDHFVADEWTLAEALRVAQRAAAAEPRRTILLGIEPDSVETDYGWILPARHRAVRPRTGAAASTLPIAAFLEKPSRATATDLWARGAVWNGFLVVARGRALRTLYEQRLPALLAAFDAAAPHLATTRTAALYDRLDSRDFSRDLLEGSLPSLGVQIAPACGWTDLGTPERVRRCLRDCRRPASSVGPGCRTALDLAATLATTVQP